VISEAQLKVVSYNCLGPLHGESLKHSYAPMKIRKWTRRRDKLVKELRQMDADIFCLQEVSRRSLKETYIPGLKRQGLELYGYAPTKQSSEEKGINGHKHVGCAIFARESKVELLATKRLHLRDYCADQLNTSRSEGFKYDIKTKWNSMVMVHGRLIASNQTFVIANTHIFWDPSRPDLKILQVAAAMDAIQRFCRESSYVEGFLPPIILCGDFNSLTTRTNTSSDPSAMSMLLEASSLSSLDPEHPDVYYQSLGNLVSPSIGKPMTV
jgi:mRNA deadenylase 3'-5' endonuclease subunit Ccr4